MTEFSAVYYDGRTSVRAAVRVRGLPHGLHIAGENINLEVPLAQARLRAPIPGARQVLDLPDGAQLQTDDRAALEALFPRANRLETWVHALERRWRYALAALAFVMALGAWGILHGLPLAARLAADFVPQELESRLGEQTLASLDRAFCAPSELPGARQQPLRERFDTLTAGLGDGHRYRLELRSCARLGANALALPGGTIVLTDELVRLARNDAQLSAVLAHEIGHVRYRHGLRQVLQAAGLAALIATLAGDAASITNLAVALPTLLLQSGYSREFEDESDGYALVRLKEIGLSPKHFAEILMQLEEQRNRSTHTNQTAGNVRAFEYLSTHPATARRIERALANQ